MALGLIKKILERKKEIKEKEEKNIIATCFICNQPIFEGDNYKKLNFQGNTYYVHLKCFRKAKKMAKKLIRSGIPNMNMLK